MCRITVFTPTYNRAYALPHLYETLQAQTFRDFEWLIVDDGSSDNTEELIQGWINDARLPIRYIKTPNGGKHRAINKGLALAKGELFFIVDSDDWLPIDSLYWINYHYQEIKDDDSFAGVGASRCYPDGKIIGDKVPNDIIDTDVVSFRETFKIYGDMAEAWKTKVLSLYPFPEFPGEMFLTEAVVWNRMAKKYKLRYFNKAIYTCEYLQDGLTSHIRRHHRNSPQGTMLFYSELVRDKRFSWVSRMKAAANYWRYTVLCHCKRPSVPLWVKLFYVLGFLFMCKDLLNERAKR